MADVETIFRFSWRPSKLNNIHNYSFICKYKKNKTPSKPTVKGPSFRFVSCRPRDQRPNISLHSPPLTGEQAHTQPHMLKTTTKHHHHGPHNPPAPSDSNFTGECDHRTPRDRSQSLQSGDVTFIDETKTFLILFTTILCASAQRTRGAQRHCRHCIVR